MKKTSYFWIGFSDLMTSLFFIMLILFAITFISKLSDSKKVDQYDAIYEENERLKQEVNGLNTTVEKIKAIESVEKALSELDEEYYIFDPKNKRYKLNIDVQFKSNESDINNLSFNQKKQLVKAGSELYNKINNLIKSNKNIDYLLVVEGNTQRSDDNRLRDPNTGYKLSYDRALALFNFWKASGINFYDLGLNCEIIIAGSGYWGQSRDEKNPANNRRFSIQVTSKVGKFLQEKTVQIN